MVKNIPFGLGQDRDYDVLLPGVREQIASGKSP